MLVGNVHRNMTENGFVFFKRIFNVKYMFYATNNCLNGGHNEYT